MEKSDAFKDNGWMEYRNGFGKKNGNEYWMGLENMRQLLETGRWQLYIGLRALKYPTWSYIIYNDFSIGEEIKGMFHDWYPVISTRNYEKGVMSTVSRSKPL